MSCIDIEVDYVFLRTSGEECAVRDLLFENLKISGRRKGSAGQANLDIGGNVSFC